MKKRLTSKRRREPPFLMAALKTPSPRPQSTHAPPPFPFGGLFFIPPSQPCFFSVSLTKFREIPNLLLLPPLLLKSEDRVTGLILVFLSSARG